MATSTATRSLVKQHVEDELRTLYTCPSALQEMLERCFTGAHSGLELELHPEMLQRQRVVLLVEQLCHMWCFLEEACTKHADDTAFMS